MTCEGRAVWCVVCCVVCDVARAALPDFLRRRRLAAGAPATRPSSDVADSAQQTLVTRDPPTSLATLARLARPRHRRYRRLVVRYSGNSAAASSTGGRNIHGFASERRYVTILRLKFTVAR
jgi:hypothetical protein